MPQNVKMIVPRDLNSVFRIHIKMKYHSTKLSSDLHSLAPMSNRVHCAHTYAGTQNGMHAQFLKALDVYQLHIQP